MDSGPPGLPSGPGFNTRTVQAHEEAGLWPAAPGWWRLRRLREAWTPDCLPAVCTARGSAGPRERDAPIAHPTLGLRGSLRPGELGPRPRPGVGIRRGGPPERGATSPTRALACGGALASGGPGTVTGFPSCASASWLAHRRGTGLGPTTWARRRPSVRRGASRHLPEPKSPPRAPPRRPRRFYGNAARPRAQGRSRRERGEGGPGAAAPTPRPARAFAWRAPSRRVCLARRGGWCLLPGLSSWRRAAYQTPPPGSPSSLDCEPRREKANNQ